MRGLKRILPECVDKNLIYSWATGVYLMTLVNSYLDYIDGKKKLILTMENVSSSLLLNQI
jgi:hypothetical protein